MMPVYRESYTTYTTPTGNTQIYIYKRKKKISERKKGLITQKCMGAALLIIGIGGCFIFREDCGGFLFAGLMGIARLVCD